MGWVLALSAGLTALVGDVAAGEPRRAYLAQTWTSEDGLPATEVAALVQSRDGYLWVGTPGGLARFDGDRFVTYRKSETLGLASNRILSLCDDREGGVWIGTDGGGLAQLRVGTGELVSRAQGLSSMSVLSVCVDDRGGVWAGTASGLNRWQVNRFVPYLKVDGLPDETVTVLEAPEGGGLLVGTGAGLGWFREGRFIPLRPQPTLPAGRVAALHSDRSGCVWVGGDFGLWRLQPAGDGSHRCRRVSEEACTAILERRSGEIWWGTASGRVLGVWNPEDAGAEMFRFESAPAVLMEDHEGNVWVGARQGLTRLKPRQFEFLDGEAGVEQVAFASTESGGEVRVGRDGSVRCMIPGQEPRGDWVSPATRVAAVDLLGPVLWAGSSGEGLWRWDGREKRVWGQRDGLSDIFVESVYATGPDSVWVGTRNGGLNEVARGKVRRHLTPWGYTGHYASVLAAHADGTLWIGTTGDGLFSFREGVFVRHQAAAGLPDDRITGLIVAADGAVWAGTSGGLGFWDGRRWHSFGRKTGVPAEGIDQMRSDELGHLWLGCGQTLYRLDQSELRDVAAGRRETVHPVPFGRGDGLQGVTFLPGAQVGAHSRRDWVVFLTSRGLLAVEPGRMERNTNVPPVLIQEVVIGGELVPVRDRVEVPPGSGSIQIRFAALSYAAPEKVRFRCRLSGYDGGWVEMGASRTVRYPRVPHGEYRFEVTACNNDGLWNARGASTVVQVIPFWWETQWFRLGIACLGGGAALGFLHVRRLRKREIERLRVQIAGDLHDEIGSSLWSITLLSKMLQQGGSLGDEEKRDAGEIHRIATQTSNALRDIVWLINPGLDTVQDLVLRMRDHLSATVRGVEVQVSAEAVDPARQLTLEWRQSLFLMFKEAVTNAARHGRAGRIEVSLSERDGSFELRIRDDGQGFRPDEPAKGHGLKSLRRRAEAIGGRLTIESAPGRGTTVTLRAELGRGR